MNALMNIQIRVLSAQARTRIRELEAEVAMLKKQVGQANVAMNSMGTRSIPGITKWGNQIQWAGRQLQYNFTLPIVLAGAAATKFALDNEKAMVRVIKVYGDGSEAMNQLSKTEIPALEKAFISLSNRFGIAQDDAINIAADWAAAGASGVALARSVKLTMETMILGEMEAKEATEALIAIQAQYNFSTKELTETIDVLNMVENQTGISMQGLVQGMARSAGVAREMGVDVQHLAAMMAALVPATGSATAAGNGLKTILSRIMSPTNEASEVMNLMGIRTKELAWQSLNATQRLEKMASTYVTLDDAQKIVVASTAASRWQINRFGQLMSDINNPLGYYHRSLQATADTSKNFAQRQKELNTVLESSPQRLKQIWVMLQNALAKGIQPAIPALLIITNAIAKATQWFANLSPEVQKVTLAMLFLLAAIGPVVRYLGSVAVLLGVMQEAFAFVGRAVLGLGSKIIWLVTAPFKLLTSGATKVIALLVKIGPLVGGALTTAFTAAGGAIATATAFMIIKLKMLGLFFLDIAAVTKTALVLMGTNIVKIWGGTWRAIAVLFLNGTKALVAIQMIFSRNFTLMWTVLTSNILALWRVFTMGLLLNWGRLVVALPAMMAALPSTIMGIFAAIGTGIAAIFTSWVGLAAVAVVALFGVIYNFRDKIAEAFRSIPKFFSENARGFALVWAGITDLFGKGVEFINKMFWKLPEGVRDAMLAVVRIVQAAVMKVYELFSYLNPFARHSPSLVEQVTKGMAVIKKQYASVGNTGSIFAKAARDIEAYKRAIGTMGGGAFSDERADVASAFKSALPIFDALISDLSQLNVLLAQQGATLSKQQKVVDAWDAALDQANVTLDLQQLKLDALQDKLDSLNRTYQDHEQALSDYANAPLKGMGQMEDQIFANQQAQNALRLEMLKWEQVNGSIEDVKDNMSRLAGSIEMLRGEARSLQLAGAGSDILGPMQQEIAAMEAAYDSMGTTVNNSPVNEMQKQLEDLQRAGEIMDLEKALNFDGAMREIDKLANAQKELTFDEIVAGINREKAAMAALEPQIAAATNAVNAQQAAVDAAKASRDSISATYDVEKAKLDIINAAYDKTADAVRDVEEALRSMGSAAASAGNKARAAADAASGYMSPGAQNFIDSAGGNFPDVSGTGAQIGREGDLTDQSALIDQFTQDTIAEMNATLDKIDMFGGIKKKWAEFQNWWTINVSRNFIRITEGIKQIWTDFTAAIGSSGAGQGAAKAWEGFTTALGKIWDFAKRLYDLFKDDLLHIWEQIVEAGKKIWTEIGPELEKFKELIPGLTEIFGKLWTGIKYAAMVIGALLVGAFKLVTSVLSHVLGPALDMIIGVFKAIIKIVRGVIGVLVGLFTGDMDRIVQGVKDIFGGLFQGIADIIKGAWNIIWGAVEGLVNGIIDWIVWLWDELVGHSIIPDMINAIVDWFEKLPGWVWDAIIDMVNKVIEIADMMWEGFKKANVDAWNTVTTWLKERGQKAWDALIGIKDKVVDVAKKMWDAFRAKSSELWNNFITYLKERPQNAYNNFIAIKNKLIEVAKLAFEAFKSKASEIWNTFNTWLGGRPQAAYDKFKALKDKLVTAARDAFNGLLTKAKEIVDGKSGFMSWIGGIPGRVGKLLGTIGTTVANAVKGAWNGTAKWINDNGIGAINKVTSRFGFTLGKLPTFAGGGVIPGKISKRDNTIIAARTGEGVIVPELVRHMGGKRGLDAANAAAKTGNINALRNMGIERFADGGIIGKVTGWLQSGVGSAMSNIIGSFKRPVRSVIPGQPFAEDWAVGAIQGWQDKAREWGKKKEEMGAGILPHIGYQWQIKMLKEQFPNAVITSSFRPGSITALGNTSMHSIGRAIDIAPDNAIFDWIRGTYGKNTKQLFYSPRDGKTILNGRDWNMDATTKRDHWDHIHWGYDKGGILPPGLTMARNSTGRNEYTLTADQWMAFSNVVGLLDRMTLKSGMGATPGAAAVARVGATLATVEARLRSAETRNAALVPSRNGGGDTFIFNGDLEFPNITNGEDADEFIKNLKGLVG